MKKNITTENKTTMNTEEKEMKINAKICECCGEEIAIENAKLNAEEAMQEKVNDLVEKFFEEIDVDSIAQGYLDTDSLVDDYVRELFGEDCRNRLSFIDFLLGYDYINRCWDEYELRKYAENEGVDEAEATMFVEAFTCGKVGDWLDYDIAQAVFESLRGY